MFDLTPVSQEVQEKAVPMDNPPTILAGDMISIPNPGDPSIQLLLRLEDVFAFGVGTPAGEDCREELNLLIDDVPWHYTTDFSIPDRAIAQVYGTLQQVNINALMQQYIQNYTPPGVDRVDNIVEVTTPEDVPVKVLAGDLIEVPNPGDPSVYKLIRLHNVFAPDAYTDKGKQCTQYLTSLIKEAPITYKTTFNIYDRAVAVVTGLASPTPGDINNLMRIYIQHIT